MTVVIAGTLAIHMHEMKDNVKRRELKMENNEGMKMVKRKNPKIPILSTTIVPLATSRIELWTPEIRDKTAGRLVL